MLYNSKHTPQSIPYLRQLDRHATSNLHRIMLGYRYTDEILGNTNPTPSVLLSDRTNTNPSIFTVLSASRSCN
ncbi:hypothetical protein E2C01_015923 [Portunus trituberculatus]|uniref:Uncharacterized protein n=1 Tax=Portunus trituberculatus TaxID=210409 RepID=A0A5B7DNV7_PORTR|nr:hypothetical protein [Portunus trituberculatus]